MTGVEQPIYFWVPSIAPSGMAFYTGDLFPEWQGNLFVGAMAGRRLVRLVLDGERVVAEEKLLDGARPARSARCGRGRTARFTCSRAIRWCELRRANKHAIRLRRTPVALRHPELALGHAIAGRGLFGRQRERRQPARNSRCALKSVPPPRRGLSFASR